MSDQSELDRKYFIDDDKYNCPFCNRRSIVYSHHDSFNFDWSEEKSCFGYIIKCKGCNNLSLHLSYYEFRDSNAGQRFAAFEVTDEKGVVTLRKTNLEKLDTYFFYDHPTSFFTLDSRIPSKIRELVSEADGCRKMNFMTGASGALRKSIYKFLKDQKADMQKDDLGNKMSYEDQIKWVKNNHLDIHSEYFDALHNIQDMASEELHEDKDWPSWNQSEFDFIIATIKALLHEVYVEPEERKSMLSRVLSLKPLKKS